MKASAFSGSTPAFCGSPPVLTSTNEARALAKAVDFARQRCGDFLPVDRLDHIERLDRLARLVALQGSDQMEFDRLPERAGARPQIPPFGNRLLHPVLAEAGLAAYRYRGPDLVSRKSLGDGDELDRFRRPAAIARAPRDMFAQLDEPGNGVLRVRPMRRLGQNCLHVRPSHQSQRRTPPAIVCEEKREFNWRLLIITRHGPGTNRLALAFWLQPAHEGPDLSSPTTASMGFKCGIVGLPNVGKSTLFNALTQTAAAQAANYPFCTIEPNVGDVAVPDPRLAILAKIASSKEIIPTRLSFVDIAGLVRGASKGEGLGNQFLANIRECDAIAHVVRCFEDSDVTHVEGRIDPLSDIATIETELMLADLESLERRIAQMEKKAKGGDKEAKEALALAERSLAELREGRPARAAGVGRDERRLFQSLGLLSSKPVLYVCNVDEGSADRGNAFSDTVKEQAAKEGAAAVVVSAKIESEIALLPLADQEAYLEAIGLTEPGLNRVIRAGYELLHLVTFFTAGPKEARAWTIEQGAKGPQAAGVIHTDFEKGFIRAETIAYDDYVANGGEAGAREAGKFRLEGKDYVVADGDVMHFRFAN